MKIQINDHRKIFAIQEEFNKLFPRLKIEFLGKPNKTGSSASTKIYKASKKIGDCRIQHTSGELTITPNMTAADLKQILSDKFGLSISLFHTSGSEWVETTDNNKLSLQEQNEESSL
jgi:hypothetical protein